VACVPSSAIASTVRSTGRTVAIRPLSAGRVRRTPG
jgi:hypothetical protein